MLFLSVLSTVKKNNSSSLNSSQERSRISEESLHTNDYDYRDFLKERERFVGDRLRKLKESQ